jgi:leucyl aminopeptidase
MLPTSTDVKISTKSKPPADVGAVAVFVTEKPTPPESPMLADADRAAIARLLKAQVVRGKAKELAFDLVDAGKQKLRRVYVVGLDEPAKVTAESVRRASGHLARALRKHRISSVAVVLPEIETVPPEPCAEAIVTGALLARFDYDEYKGAARKRDEKEPKTPLELIILSADRQIIAAVDRARIIAESQNYCRTIATRPGNDINPPALAKIAQEMAREVGLGIKVLDEKQMQRLGMGGILAVGSGSPTPPRMIVLEWGEKRSQGRGQNSKGKSRRSSLNSDLRSLTSPLLVVGKAITFDTGGISIKPADRMQEMVFDKCGAMAVLGLMCAVAKLKLPIHVVGILSSAENMPSGTAYRPGDILRMYNKVTVEVTNTDAEGRLVLADALAWGIETYKPAAVVDLATLTGGVVVALGHEMAGVMSNNDELVSELQQAASLTGEQIWRLPVGDEQRDLMKSNYADIVNSAGRYASPLQGAAFLSYFVPRDDSVPWAQFDIAGVADTDKELPYYNKGATGWGVRTLVQWVTQRAMGTRQIMPRAAGG